MEACCHDWREANLWGWNEIAGICRWDGAYWTLPTYLDTYLGKDGLKLIKLISFTEKTPFAAVSEMTHGIPFHMSIVRT
jgi:hypothetical protein